MSAKYIAKSRAVAARKLDNEMLIMSAVDSTLFSLNEVGAAIWLAADGQTPLSEIVNKSICAEFDVSHEQAYTDAVQFAEELARHGILTISDEPMIVPALESALK